MNYKMDQLHPGMNNCEFEAIITQVTTGKTNGANKRNYLNLTLQDRSGVMEAKFWNATDEDITTYVQGTVIHGRGDIIKYNNSTQMKVIKLRRMDVSDDEKLNFLPQAPVDVDVMMKEIDDTISAMNNKPIRDITRTLIHENRTAFKSYPAASHNHHEFISGLLYHTYCMLRLAKNIASLYAGINKDLLYAGVILHDIGKIKELSGPITPHYTPMGNLIGHISIGYGMVKEAAIKLGYDGEEVMLLEHMILSHHGKQEYGSPVLPQIKEAEILYLIDNIDARMNMFDKAIMQVEEGEMTRRIFALENRTLYHPYSKEHKK